MARTSVPQRRYGLLIFFQNVPPIRISINIEAGYEGEHTIDEQNDVQDRMDHGLHHRNHGDMAMEYIKRRKAPARGPEEDVISTGKDPEEREIGKGENSGAIGHISEILFINGRPTRE